jgi:hypothetical protein
MDGWMEGSRSAYLVLLVDVEQRRHDVSDLLDCGDIERKGEKGSNLASVLV